MRTCVISGIVGKYLPTPSAPPALDFGGAPLKELQKKWSGANFLWSGVELARVFGYFFHVVELDLVEQNAPKYPLNYKLVQNIYLKWILGYNNSSALS